MMNDFNFSALITPREKPATPLRVAVLGGGSFGTAMANLAARNGCETCMWIRDENAVKDMQQTKRNMRYLPDFQLEDSLQFSSRLEDVVPNPATPIGMCLSRLLQ